VFGGGTTLTQSGSPTFFCQDNAGNSTPTEPVQVLIDGTAPAIGGLELTTADGQPYTSGDWTTQDVVLSWTCTDAPGGSGAVPTSDSVLAETTGTLRAVCTDVAGNDVTGEAFQANIDTEAPVLAGVPGNRSATKGTVSWPAPTATDDQDSSVEVTCDPASGSSFPVGVTTVTCTATDHAGNASSASFTVTVVQQVLGVTFDKPVDGPVMNVAKLGRVIPVKAILSRDGAPISGPSSEPVHLQASRIACTFTGTEDAVETYAAGSSSTGNLFRWDAGAGRWTYNLDTSSLGAKAGSCYRISVFYGGTVVDGRATGGVSAGSFFVQTKK
jgi:hypothetical protein